MQKPQQKTVRAGQLERVLGDVNADIGKKTGILLSEYHARFIAPLETRIAALEAPLYRRLWRRVADSSVAAWIVAYSAAIVDVVTRRRERRRRP